MPPHEKRTVQQPRGRRTSSIVALLQQGMVRMSGRESAADNSSSDEDEDGGEGLHGPAAPPPSMPPAPGHEGSASLRSTFSAPMAPPRLPGEQDGRKTQTSVVRDTVRYSQGRESGGAGSDGARSRPRGNSREVEQVMDGASGRMLVSITL